MQGQEFLIQAIQDIIPDNETVDSIKHLSRTSLIEIPAYPAVLVEEEPYDFNQDTGHSDILYRKEKCNLAVIIESTNVNELTEIAYTTTKEKLKLITDEVIAAILEKVPNFNKVANLRLGTGEVYDGVIGSVPVMWNVIPVEVILVN
jgi:hypothetical protein